MIENVQRVLMTGDAVGGVWTFTLELAAQLGEFGVEVVLVTFGGMPGPQQARDAASLPSLTLISKPWKLEWMTDPWCDLERSAELVHSLSQEFHPDVIHLNSFGLGGAMPRLPTVLTAHSCVLSWWSEVHGCPAPRSWDRYRAVVAAALESADIVTAPGRSMMRSLESNYGVPLEGRCSVVPNGRSAELFWPGEKEPLIVSAGRLWDEGKNIAALDKAAAHLPWQVQVAGCSQHTEGANYRPAHCRELGELNTRQLAALYRRAAIYALPAKYEPFGLTILEAALSGCALVLGDIESLRDTWQECALYVNPHDPVALARTLSGLIAHEQLRMRLAKASLVCARTYSPERMARCYLSCYRSVVREEQLCT